MSQPTETQPAGRATAPDTPLWATGTWKVVLPMPGEDEDDAPAVVWRDSEAGCEAWIESRIGLEPAQACLDYAIAGPLAPVRLAYGVVDRLRPPGEARLVERFADAAEAAAWVRAQSDVEALAATPGDYEAVGPETIEAALAAPARRVRRGGAVHDVPPPPGAARPDLRVLERSTVARLMPTGLGTIEVRAYADGHLRVSAGSLFDRAVEAPESALEGGGRVAFEAVARLEGDRLSSRGLRFEARDASGEPIEAPRALRAAVDQVRGAVREAVNGLLDAHPGDRDEALERYLQALLARNASERRSVQARLATLDRSDARADALLAEVRAKLADGADADASVPAP